MTTRVLPYVALAAALLAEAAVLYPPPFNLTDYLVFWEAGHMFASGASPYDLAQWQEPGARFGGHLAYLASNPRGVPWPYPPWTVYLFVPFGLLPPELGTWALHLASVATGIGAAILIARLVPWRSRWTYAAFLVLVATFQPLVIAARWGQFGGFLLLGVALVATALTSGGTLAYVLGALLLATKPHLAAGFAPVSVVMLAASRAWSTIAVTAAALAALAAASFASQPLALGTISSGAADRLAQLRVFGSSWSFAFDVAGDAGLIVGAVLLASTAVVCVFAVRWAPARLGRLTAIAAAFVFSIAAVPYLFSYDQVLLAPAIAVALASGERAPDRFRALHLTVVLLAVAVLPWLLFFIGSFRSTQAASGLLPVVMALLLAASARLAAAFERR